MLSTREDNNPSISPVPNYFERRSGVGEGVLMSRVGDLSGGLVDTCLRGVGGLGGALFHSVGGLSRTVLSSSFGVMAQIFHVLPDLRVSRRGKRSGGEEGERQQ